jgi:hypothetical protein
MAVVTDTSTNLEDRATGNADTEAGEVLQSTGVVPKVMMAVERIERRTARTSYSAHLTSKAEKGGAHPGSPETIYFEADDDRSLLVTIEA